jgi:hypothetical protein
MLCSKYKTTMDKVQNFERYIPSSQTYRSAHLFLLGRQRSGMFTAQCNLGGVMCADEKGPLELAAQDGFPFLENKM